MDWFVRKTIGNVLATGVCLVAIHAFTSAEKLLSFLLYCGAVLGLMLVLAALFFYLRHFVPLRKKESGFEYVYVEDDGTVREVSEDDQNYLSTYFSPGDGGRPSIKTRYKSRNGWDSIRGFIPRRRVPRRLPIGPYVPANQPEVDPYYCQ